MNIQDWIDNKLTIIANKLPDLVYTQPASFACGHAMGYKQALLDLERVLKEEGTNEWD